MRVVRAQTNLGIAGSDSGVTLEPLKLQGESVVNCSAIPGLKKIVLREVHLFRRDLRHQPVVRISRDIFRDYACDDAHDLFPLDCTITRAVFDLHFFGSPIPRSVVIQPPATTEPERHTDAQIIRHWAALVGFIVPLAPRDNPDEQAMAIP